MEISPEWRDAISEIVSAPGVVMVVGSIDTGKTTFCRQLCNASVEAGIPTAFVDADVGQSELGAPGTIGVAVVEEPVESLSSLRPRRQYFVGSTSPPGHLVECITGTHKAVEFARGNGAEMVAVDTTGLVHGPVGRKLKTYKIGMVRPDYLVGIQRRREIEHVLVPFAKMESVSVRRLPVSEEARKKPVQLRTARRKMNFYSHFHDAAGHVINMDDVCFWNSRFRTGRPIKWQYVRFIEQTLGCPVMHAEVTGTGVYIVSEKRAAADARRVLEEQFKTTDITIVTPNSFVNLLIGLADQNAVTLNVGLIQSIDFKQKYIFVLSPLKTVSPVRIIQFGSIRVTAEGDEIGTVRQGEL